MRRFASAAGRRLANPLGRLLFEHPYLVLVSTFLALPTLLPLVGLFFGGSSQFAEDVGITSSQNRWRVLVGIFSLDNGVYRGQPGVLLNIIGLLLSFAAVAAAAYHLLLWLLPIVGFPLPPAP
jgi:hypothetical protein